MSRQGRPGDPFSSPPPQDNLKRATELAFDKLGNQTEDQLAWLGAEIAGSHWRLPVLDDTFVVDLGDRRVTTADGEAVGPAWRILALHYLAISAQPEERSPEVTFADLSRARSYAGIYHQRVIARLCGTAGRDAERLQEAATTLGGKSIPGGDLTFDFAIFPRLVLRLIWHAPDDEFPASATLLLPDNVECFFCSEDIVVLSESLVSRLSGRPF